MIPDGLNDRAADNWRLLLVIAEAVGGEWPSLAREAAVLLSGFGVRDDSSDAGCLLADLRRIFDSRRNRYVRRNIALALRRGYFSQQPVRGRAIFDDREERPTCRHRH